jgi:hypothetical protein
MKSGQLISLLEVLPDNVLYWPGKGNSFLTAKGYDMNNNLAPFFDRDGRWRL